MQVEMKNENKKRALHRTLVFWNASYFLLAILAILSLIGVIVSAILLETGTPSPSRDMLLYILIGSFAGGAGILAGCSVGGAMLAKRAKLRETDYRELCVSPHSFFVGDGTLATLLDDKLHIHLEGKSVFEEDGIDIPYADVRFFSVCTRRRPREKGEWSVVFEIPVKYLAKDGTAKKDAPPALIQTDAKPRLYERLSSLGINLLGEAYHNGKEKFRRQKAFFLPNRTKRKRALMGIGLGAIVLVGGIFAAIFWREHIIIGAIACVLGGFFALRSLFSYLRAKATFAFYEEGIFWQESDRVQSVFLKWEEVESITPEEENEMPVLTVQCAYGAYHFPNVVGAWEELCARFPEKCGVKS